MTVTLACPEDNDPLSYDRLDGEWRQWYETAHRFEHKVPAQDRGDIRHNIILELALADTEHLRPAGGANPLGGWLTIFHGNGFGIFHFFLGAAFDAICLHGCPP